MARDRACRQQQNGAEKNKAGEGKKHQSRTRTKRASQIGGTEGEREGKYII